MAGSRVQEIYEQAKKHNDPNAFKKLEDIANCPSQYTEVEIHTAINSLGGCWAGGFGTSINPGRAVDCYTKSAMLGNPHAMLNLAYYYLRGISVKRDILKTIYWFQQAKQHSSHATKSSTGSSIIHDLLGYAEANKKDAVVWNFLGNCYYEGSTTYKNLPKAFECFSTAAQDENDEALCSLASMYEKGDHVAVNIEAAIDLYFKATKKKTTNSKGSLLALEKLKSYATAGNIIAMNKLAAAILHGNTPKRDYDTAIELLKTAAEGGNAISMTNLGAVYTNGLDQSIGPNLKEAAYWYHRSAKVPSLNPKAGVLATKNLEELYKQYPNNQDIAFAWADCLLNGYSVAQNQPQALSILEVLAQNKHALANYVLGDYYEQKSDAAANLEMISKYFYEAAKMKKPHSNYLPLQRLLALTQKYDINIKVLDRTASCFFFGYDTNRDFLIARAVYLRMNDILYEEIITNKAKGETINFRFVMMVAVYERIAQCEVSDLQKLTQDRIMSTEELLLITILQSVTSTSIQLLVNNKELRKQLQEIALPQAQRLTTFLDRYEEINLGLDRMHKARKDFIAALIRQLDDENLTFPIIGFWGATRGRTRSLKYLKDTVLKEFDIQADHSVGKIKSIFDLIYARLTQEGVHAYRYSETRAYYTKLVALMDELKIFSPPDGLQLARLTTLNRGQAIFSRASSPPPLPPAPPVNATEKKATDTTPKGQFFLIPLPNDSVIETTPTAEQVSAPPEEIPPVAFSVAPGAIPIAEQPSAPPIEQDAAPTEIQQAQSSLPEPPLNASPRMQQNPPQSQPSVYESLHWLASKKSAFPPLNPANLIPNYRTPIAFIDKFPPVASSELLGTFGTFSVNQSQQSGVPTSPPTNAPVLSGGG